MGHPKKDAEQLSEFDLKVKHVVSRIPEGTVLSYGEVALLAGRPGGARAVVRALWRVSGIPWWRVVRSDRTLAVEIAGKQAPKLRKEGVQLAGRRIVATRENAALARRSSRG